MGLSNPGDMKVACSSASPERPLGEVTISLQTNGPTIVKQMDFGVRMPLEKKQSRFLSIVVMRMK